LLLHHWHGALRDPDQDVLEQPHGPAWNAESAWTGVSLPRVATSWS